MGIAFLRSSGRQPCARTALRRLTRRIRHLATRNVHLGRVTVLIQGGQDVPSVTTCFSRRAPCHVMSSRTFQLDTSLTIDVLVSKLQCLSSPSSHVTLTQLTITCRRKMLHGSVDLGAILLSSPTHCLPTTFRLRTGRLHFVPLCRLLRGLFILFSVRLVRGRSTCLYTFCSTIARCLRGGSSRLATFVHF